MTRTWPRAALAAALLTTMIANSAQGRVPEPLYQKLKQIGQVLVMFSLSYGCGLRGSPSPFRAGSSAAP